MSEFQLEVEKLRARFEGMAHALLCVGPVDLAVTSRTVKLHYAQQPEVIAKLKQWLREDLALYAAGEKLAVLGEPVLVLDGEGGHGQLAILAVTLPWGTLQHQFDAQDGMRTAPVGQRAVLDEMTREAAADGSYAEATEFTQTR